MSYLKSAKFWKRRWQDMKDSSFYYLLGLTSAVVLIVDNEMKEKLAKEGKYIWELHFPKKIEGEKSVWRRENISIPLHALEKMKEKKEEQFFVDDETEIENIDLKKKEDK